MSNNTQLSQSQIDNETVIIQKLMEQDDFPATKAVEEIVALCLEAATSGQDALESHARRVIRNIYTLAVQKPPSQQLKLVRFVDLLQQQSIHDPKTGEVLTADESELWTGMPHLSMAIAEHRIREETTLEARRNLAALLAQLYEAKSKYLSRLEGVIYDMIVWSFEADYGWGRDIMQVAVQVACVWLIYAPRRIWKNVQTRLETTEGTYDPAHWARLKEVLKNSQGEYLDELTQDLIWQALNSMDNVEKEGADK